MYKVIGNDGQIYGPVAADKIREWIKQGRLESRTAILPDGAAEWTFVGLLPEFAGEFSTQPPLITPTKAAATPVHARPNNGFATAGFTCGILSLVFCCCCGGFPFNLLGLVFSIIALAQINGQTEKQAGWGLALTGLICSALSLLGGLGFGILQLVSTPNHVSWHYGAF